MLSFHRTSTSCQILTLVENSASREGSTALAEVDRTDFLCLKAQLVLGTQHQSDSVKKLTRAPCRMVAVEKLMSNLTSPWPSNSKTEASKKKKKRVTPSPDNGKNTYRSLMPLAGPSTSCRTRMTSPRGLAGYILSQWRYVQIRRSCAVGARTHMY